MKLSVKVLSGICGCALLLGANQSFGQLYSQNFDVDDTANWTVNSSEEGIDLGTGNTVPLDTDANFFFDYSTVGIPSAPNSTGGTTRGMKLQANLFSDAFGGFSVSPTGQSFTGDYTLSFDMWSNYPGDLLPGGSGSTNLSFAGVLSSGTFENKPGAADGVWFAYTGDGDSGSDYRAYSSERAVSYQFPVDPNVPEDLHATYLAGSRDHTAPLYFNNINPEFDPVNFPGVGIVEAPADQLDLFPQQTGRVRAGAPGMAWRQHEITKLGDLVSWKVDGIELITVDISDFSTPNGGDNILFGHSDINGSSSTDIDAEFLLFTLVDNVVVSTAAAVEDADFDADGDVDGRDFLTWQGSYPIDDGTALLADGDANADGNVNNADLAIWQSQLGNSSSVAAISAVPEPSGILLLLAAWMSSCLVCPRRPNR